MFSKCFQNVNWLFTINIKVIKNGIKIPIECAKNFENIKKS